MGPGDSLFYYNCSPGYRDQFPPGKWLFWRVNLMAMYPAEDPSLPNPPSACCTPQIFRYFPIQSWQPYCQWLFSMSSRDPLVGDVQYWTWGLCVQILCSITKLDAFLSFLFLSDSVHWWYAASLAMCCVVGWPVWTTKKFVTRSSWDTEITHFLLRTVTYTSK